MINRGNIALIEKDYGAAERWFRQALGVQPGNATLDAARAVALRGLEQVQAERNN
jgi:hypothetical protein